MSSLTDKIESDISPLVGDYGCNVVRVAIFGQGRGKTLQIMLEKKDGDTVTIEDCEQVSRGLSIFFDVNEPMTGHYNLEVSSTGIDRPLTKQKDYERFCGNYVVVKTYVSKNNRKNFKGLLESVMESGIKIRLDDSLTVDEPITLLYEEISSAHLDGFRKK